MPHIYFYAVCLLKPLGDVYLTCMARERSGFKALSPRTPTEETHISLYKELMEWLKAKAHKEANNLSFTEILERAKQIKEAKQGGK